MLLAVQPEGFTPILPATESILHAGSHDERPVRLQHVLAMLLAGETCWPPLQPAS